MPRRARYVPFEEDVELVSVEPPQPRAAKHGRGVRGGLRDGIKLGLLTRPICAVDGEGKTAPDGSHHYTLLAGSWPTGKLKMEGASLSTDDCLEFLMHLPPGHTYVIYGGNYDANMMLRMLPRAAINLLLDTGETRYGSYHIQWIERKFLRVKRGNKSVTLYDVLANFQVPFVARHNGEKGACESWKIGTAEELALIQSMKEQRGQFDSVDDTEIESYCFLECDLLRKLCRSLFDAILETGYRPKAVYGPGALAAAAFSQHGIKRYMAELPEPLDELANYAYFGGRFDCSMFGWFTDVYQYDIKSAYPDQIRYLPCLAHATWQKHPRPRQLAEWGLYQVEWNVSPDEAWPPFPHRDSKGNVWYPSQGKGWYHADEVRAALERFPDAINVIGGYALVRHCDHQPFSFVDTLFAVRQTLPYDQGIVFKLILNSLYGKLAQQVGTRNDKPPQWQNFFWAGAITSGTRAKLSRAIAQSPTSVLGIATDGLVTLRQFDLPIGTKLGEWESKALREYAQISNGVYYASDQDGKGIERSRGFGRATLNWTDVRADYERTRGLGRHKFEGKSRFITLREARYRHDRAQVECRWITQPRELSFYPARRWYNGYELVDGLPRVTLGLYEPVSNYESQPFRIKVQSQEVIDNRVRYNAYDWHEW